MDALTRQILDRIDRLPIRKRAALLELLMAETTSSPQQNLSPDEWKKLLIETSVWTDEELEGILEARSWMNQWSLPSL